MAPPICTDQVVTVPQTEYVCPISDDNSDFEPPVSKRQKKWILNITKEWDKDDMVDIYGSEVGPRQISSFILETVCLLSDAAYVQHQSVSNFAFVTYTSNVSVNSEMDTNGSNTKCLSCEDRNKIWIINSGASMHFTPDQSDFMMYQPLGNHKTPVSTAAGVIHVVGKGSVWIRWRDPQGVNQILTLYDVGHLLWNLSASMMFTIFSSLLMNLHMFLLWNSLLHQTGFATFHVHPTCLISLDGTPPQSFSSFFYSQSSTG